MNLERHAHFPKPKYWTGIPLQNPARQDFTTPKKHNFNTLFLHRTKYSKTLAPTELFRHHQHHTKLPPPDQYLVRHLVPSCLASPSTTGPKLWFGEACSSTGQGRHQRRITSPPPSFFVLLLPPSMTFDDELLV